MPSNTTPALALLLAGGIVFEAARSKRSIVDTALGRTPTTGVPASAGPVLSAVNSITTAANTAAKKAGTATYDGHPVALWIIPCLAWARKSGLWKGSVTSGYRTPAAQIQAATNYGLQHYPNGPLASNHVRKMYPGGAVDVSDPEGLNRAMAKCPIRPKLTWGGPVMGDTVHFSANGH